MAGTASHFLRLSGGGSVVFKKWFTSSQRLGLTSVLPSRTIAGKTMRSTAAVEKPAPFPYKEKTFRYWHLHLDKTSKRFDENTKIIVVEGNVAVGKTTLAKALAEEFDMLYIPEADMDLEYKNEFGYDMRDYKHQIPDSMKPFDLTDFYANPNHPNVSVFQMRMYKHRYYQYIDALKHIFNTGQGVVMDRCVYSDYCFVETMVKHGYMGKAAKYYYYEVRKNSIHILMRPHLIVYLDVPIDIIKERIKKRGNDYEQNTSVLSTEYLQTLADVYKRQYLKDIGKHAELLIYDWSKFGDAEMVVEDIERIDFDRFDKYDPKMDDWKFYREQDYGNRRMMYTRRQHILDSYLNVPLLSVPEMFVSGPDWKAYEAVWRTVPGNKYTPGFNEESGDKNTLFKL